MPKITYDTEKYLGCRYDPENYLMFQLLLAFNYDLGAFILWRDNVYNITG